MKKIFVSSIFMISTASAIAQGMKPVDGFFKVCMGSLGNQSQGEASAQKLGFVAASEEQKRNLLRHGSVRSVYVNDGLALVLEQGGLCTIFAHADDLAAVQEELKRALPPPSTPFKVIEEPLGDNANVSGTVYHLALPTGPFADWVFSAYNQAGKYNVAISMQVQRK